MTITNMYRRIDKFKPDIKQTAIDMLRDATNANWDADVLGELILLVNDVNKLIYKIETDKFKPKMASITEAPEPKHNDCGKVIS